MKNRNCITWWVTNGVIIHIINVLGQQSPPHKEEKAHKESSSQDDPSGDGLLCGTFRKAPTNGQSVDSKRNDGIKEKRNPSKDSHTCCSISDLEFVATLVVHVCVGTVEGNDQDGKHKQQSTEAHPNESILLGMLAHSSSS